MSNTSLDHASKAYLVYYKCNFTSKTENLIAECKAIIERMDNTRYIDPEKNKLPISPGYTNSTTFILFTTNAFVLNRRA
jgi:hypothetical protein